MKRLCMLLIVAGALWNLASPATAQHWRHDRHIHRFHEHDARLWRGGYWFNGAHGGRLGWYWVVGGAYYAYAAPVYPYPNPYMPPVVVTSPPVIVTPPQVVQLAPAPAAPAQAAQSTQYWYFCEPSNNYYPYVATCAAPWRPVPAVPPTNQ